MSTNTYYDCAQYEAVKNSDDHAVRITLLGMSGKLSNAAVEALAVGHTSLEYLNLSRTAGLSKADPLRLIHTPLTATAIEALVVGCTRLRLLNLG
jgi:hypothetical protein